MYVRVLLRLLYTSRRGGGEVALGRGLALAGLVIYLALSSFCSIYAVFLAFLRYLLVILVDFCPLSSVCIFSDCFSCWCRCCCCCCCCCILLQLLIFFFLVTFPACVLAAVFHLALNASLWFCLSRGLQARRLPATAASGDNSSSRSTRTAAAVGAEQQQLFM